jgi:uncharacterized membrane protein
MHPGRSEELSNLERRVAALEQQLAQLTGASAPAPAAVAQATAVREGLVVSADGVRRYYRAGHLHRLDGPAEIWPDGRRAWWIDGVRQRVEDPAAAAPPAAAGPPAAGEPFQWRHAAPAVTQAQALAWAGGAVTLLGILFFFVLAAEHGWFTPPMRLGLGAAVSVALLAAGIRIHRRSGRYETALAAAAAGVAGLYATLYAATSLYGYVGRPGALALAAAVAAVAVAVSLLMEAESLAAFGIVAAMLAPPLVQDGVTTTGCAFAGVMLAGAVALVRARRWPRMLVACVVASGPQVLLLPLGDVERAYRGGTSLLALAVGFALLYLAAAFVHGLRGDRTTLDTATSTPVLMAASVLTIGIIRALNGDVAGVSLEGAGFLAAAAGFAGTGLVPALMGRRFGDLSDLLWAIALAYAAAGSGEIASGQSVAIVWAAEGAMLAVAARRIGKDRLYAPAVAYLALAAGDALAFEAPPDHLLSAGAGLHQGLAALAAVVAGVAVLWVTLAGRRAQPVVAWVVVAAAAYAAAEGAPGRWLVIAWAAGAAAFVVAGDRFRRPDAFLHAAALLALAAADAVFVQASPFHLALDGAGTASAAGWQSLTAALATAALAATALRGGRVRHERGARAALAVAVGLGMYLATAVLDGQWLVAGWAAETAALAMLGWRVRWNAPAAAAAVVWAVAVLDTLAWQSPPADLFRAGPQPASGLPSVLCAAAAAAVIAWVRRHEPDLRTAVWAAATAAVYAVSVALLGGAEALRSTGLGGGDVRSAFQDGHTAVSAFWAVGGLAALYVGLRRDARMLKAAGFGLLCAALAKIFLYDLAHLSSLTRAASFLAVGMALLAGALFIQRFAPRLVQPGR